MLKIGSNPVAPILLFLINNYLEICSFCCDNIVITNNVVKNQWQISVQIVVLTESVLAASPTE